MITGEIKLYDEPLPTYQSYNVVVTQETAAERDAWLKRCQEDLDKAKIIFAIGDTVCTKVNSQSPLTVMCFIDDINTMQKYQGQPCIIKCKNLAFKAAQEIQYSFNELDLQTIEKKDSSNV